nr:MAG TPA: hypothetical protein [Caudoviricetes sp.]
MISHYKKCSAFNSFDRNVCIICLHSYSPPVFFSLSIILASFKVTLVQKK